MFVRHASIPFRGDFVFVVIVLSGLFLQIAHAEIENATSTDTGPVSQIATTTEVHIEESSPIPYVTEALLGEEVFGDFVVGPGKFEIAIQPGESKTVEVTVSNRTGGPRFFEIVAEDAMGSTDPSQTLVLLGDDRGPYSLKDYVKVQAPRFQLPHNTRARIPVTITIPPDAEPGGLYGSLLVSTVSTEAHAGDGQGTAPQSAVVARIGALFFVTIPGDVAKDGALKDFTTVPPQAL